MQRPCAAQAVAAGTARVGAEEAACKIIGLAQQLSSLAMFAAYPRYKWLPNALPLLIRPSLRRL